MAKFLNDVLRSDTPITYTLALIIFLLSLVSIYKPSIFIKLILHPYSIVHHKQYYRLLTSELVHNDLVHLGLNTFMLVLVGGGLEETLNQGDGSGSWAFLFIYLFSYFSAIIYSTIKHRDNFDFSSAGASGSIMGLFFSFIILRPSYIAFYLPAIGGVKNICGGLIYIAILTVLQQRRKESMTNHELHFFGALGGCIATWILFPHIIT